MLAEKQYECCGIALFNQDGEPLEFHYGGITKSVFAVQGHTLSKLHIYMNTGDNDIELLKCDTEQEAKKISILDAEVNL